MLLVDSRLHPLRNPDTLVLAGLGVSSAVVNLVLLARFGVRHGGDTFRFLDSATDLAAGRPFHVNTAPFHLGYIGLVAVSQAVGAGQAGIIAFQFVVAALATLALYDIGRQLSGRLVGVLAAGFFVVDVDIARWHVYVLSDSLYISSVVLATWFVHRAVGRGARTYLDAALVGLLAAAIRPNGWIVVLVGAIYWIAGTGLRKRTKWAAACAVLVCAASAVSIAAFHRYAQAESIQARTGQLPFDDTAAPAEEWIGWLGYPVRRPPLARRAAMRVLVELLHVRPYNSTVHNATVLVLITVTYPLAVVGFMRRRDQPLSYLMGAVIAGHLLIVAVTFWDWDGRYLLYVFPLIVVFAACGATALRPAARIGSARVGRP